MEQPDRLESVDRFSKATSSHCVYDDHGEILPFGDLILQLNVWFQPSRDLLLYNMPPKAAASAILQDPDAQIPLQQWLKLLNTRGVDMRVAMGLAGKM